MTPGLPPAGAAGQFIGFDADGRVYVLHWRAGTIGWVGSGQSRAVYPQDRNPIVRHVSVAAIEAAFAPPAQDTTAEAP